MAMNCTPNYFPPDFLTDSLTETSYGVACISGMYVAHLFCAYVSVLAGFLALVARAVPRLRPFHKYPGGLFMIIIYFAEGSAMLIFNTGLPRAIIFFLTLMLVSMTVGYCAIRPYQAQVRNKVILQADLLQQEDPSVPLSKQLQIATEMVREEPRSWFQRLFSLKAVHGYFMTLAWYQMAGRAMVVNPFDGFRGCFAYPVYKNLGSNGELVLLPEVSEEDLHFQLTLATSVTIPAVFGFILIGATYALVADWWARRKSRTNRETVSCFPHK